MLTHSKPKEANGGGAAASAGGRGGAGGREPIPQALLPPAPRRAPKRAPNKAQRAYGSAVLYFAKPAGWTSGSSVVACTAVRGGPTAAGLRRVLVLVWVVALRGVPPGRGRGSVRG